MWVWQSWGHQDPVWLTQALFGDAHTWWGLTQRGFFSTVPERHMLRKAQSYRVKKSGEEDTKIFPTFSVLADSSRAIPQLCKGRVTRLELLWGKQQL